MKVAECMQKNVRLCAPTDTIQEAAMTMKEIDAGLIPVGENDRLVGTVTERDMAVRAIAMGLGCDTKVRDVMSSGIRYCLDTDDVDYAAKQMGKLQIRRLPVVNHDKRLVGIISLGDIAQHLETQGGAALKHISKSADGHLRA